MELFCISKLINCVLETDEEFVCMDFHFAVRAVRPRALAAADDEQLAAVCGACSSMVCCPVSGWHDAFANSQGWHCMPCLSPDLLLLCPLPCPPQVSDGGVASVLQLLHLFLEQPRWEETAMERSKQQVGRRPSCWDGAADGTGC